jgi:LysR family transcriptional regulator for metE and metH
MRHLKVVAAIAEEASVTRAATRLHLTQSALSHQLRDAEELLGRPLFERRSRKMVLTAAGELLLRSARSVLDELDRAEKEIQRSGSAERGLIRLSTQCYTVYHWLPPRLKIFQKKYPAVDVQLVVEATPHPFEALLDGKLDLAIACYPVRNSKIEYTPLARDEMVVLVPPHHPWAAKPFVNPQDFAHEDLIIYPPLEESSVLLKFLNPAGVVPRRIREVMLTEAILELVKAGMGVAVLARWAVAPQLTSAELRAVRLTRDGFYRDWSIARLKPHASRSSSETQHTGVRTPRIHPGAPAYLDEFIRILVGHPIHLPVPLPRAKRAVARRQPNSSAPHKRRATRA